MRIVRTLDDLKAPPQGSVVTLGNFDGVHLGHREIFRKVVRRAEERGETSVVLTFVPHPLKYLCPAKAPRLINTYEEKERLIEASRIDLLVCAPFDSRLASLSAERFVADVLVKRLALHHLIVGYDYAFGRGREGDVSFLERKGKEMGFTLDVLAPISKGGEVYSSSRIRQLLTEGDVSRVIDLLGRNFTLEGTVVRGMNRGKGLGFPTANIETTKELIPKAGVYAVKVRRGDSLLDGVVNIGCNPTFGGDELTVEVHLFDFEGDIYGESLRLYFVERLREEKVFSGVNELVRAIAADVERARKILEKSRLVEFREYLGTAGDQNRDGR